MLRKLAGGLPTGEYSRRYLGPNSGEWIVRTDPPRPAGSSRCVDRLSRDLPRSVTEPTSPSTRLYERCGFQRGDATRIVPRVRNLCHHGIESSYIDYLSHDCRAFIPVVRCSPSKARVGDALPAPAPPQCSPLLKLARPVMAERSAGRTRSRRCSRRRRGSGRHETGERTLTERGSQHRAASGRSVPESRCASQGGWDMKRGRAAARAKRRALAVALALRWRVQRSRRSLPARQTSRGPRQGQGSSLIAAKAFCCARNPTTGRRCWPPLPRERPSTYAPMSPTPSTILTG